MTGLGGISAIGMIAGMTTPLVLKAEARANEMELANALKVYAGAQMLYRQEKGRYAEDLAGLGEVMELDDELSGVLEEADFNALVFGGRWEEQRRADTIIGFASSPKDPEMVLVARLDGPVVPLPRAKMREQLEMRLEEE